MHLYTAAVYTNDYMPGQSRHQELTEYEKSLCAAVPNILESYHYVYKQKYVDEMRKNNAKVFLDSGAFSAHTLGVQLNLVEYCEYIKRNIDILRVEGNSVMASVLDGIGDPLKTWRNQLDMERFGVRPLPCFHYGEDERYLEWYMSRYEYITLGGMVGKTQQNLRNWLDRIWGKYLSDGSGKARIMVHGFGLTSFSLMSEYPWYSCDSSSWIQMTSFGSVMHPTHGPISVSEKSPSRHNKGRHLTNFTQPEQEYLTSEFQKQGFEYERLSKVYQSRAAYNLWAFGQLNERVNTTVSSALKTKVQELF